LVGEGIGLQIERQ